MILNVIIILGILGGKWNLGKAFNLDISSAQIYRGPNDSMFGFSVAQHRDNDLNSSWLLVGAPTADSDQPGVLKGGAVFRCHDVNVNNCEILKFDQTGNHKIGNIEMGYKSGQWFGATVKSSNDNSIILACASRYSWRTSNKAFYGKNLGTKKIDQQVGTCFIARKSFTDFSEYSPCRTDINHGYKEFGFCQVGLGADLAKDGRQVFIGAVGIKYHHGEMVVLDNSSMNLYKNQSEKYGHYQFVAPPGQFENLFGPAWPIIKWTTTSSNSVFNENGYLGYSIAAGEFNGDSVSDAAAGMPRGENLKGMVIVFSSKLVPLIKFYGEQIGAYFGYSLCVLDVNGDGRDDIVVSAPMFSEYKDAIRGSDIGRVYIYYQTGKGQFEKNDMLDGHDAHGRFGLSLSPIGDLNRDNFEDLAVGAPYGGPNQQGAVYIYNGGQSGIKREYSQVIYGSDTQINLHTFGFSMSGGKDLDGNGYPDLLIGAYKSDSVVNFRSQPVVKVDVNLTFPSGNINLDNKNCSLKIGTRVTCFPIRLCISYRSYMLSDAVDFNIYFVLDYRTTIVPRMYFIANEGSHILNKTITLKFKHITCLNTQVYIPEGIIDKTTPFEVDLQYSINQTTSKKHLQYIIDTGASTILRELVFIKRNCGLDNVCVTDLGLTVSQSHQSFILGSTSRIWIGIEVENYRENSYGSTLFVQIPVGLSYQNIELLDNQGGITILCSASYTSILKCEIGDPLPASTKIILKLFFQVGRTISIKKSDKLSYEFTITVNSTDPEEKLENNLRTILIPIIIKTELEAFGFSKPNSIIYNISQQNRGVADTNDEHYIGPEIIHSFELKCIGPSNIDEAHIDILWPSLTNNGKPLLYLLEQPIIEGHGKCDFVTQVNPLNLTIHQHRLKFQPRRSVLIVDDSNEQTETENTDFFKYTTNTENDIDKNSSNISSLYTTTQDVSDLDFSSISTGFSQSKVPLRNENLVRGQIQDTLEQCENKKCIRVKCHIGPLTSNSATNVIIHLRGRLYSDTLKSLSLKGLEKLNVKSKLTGQISILPYKTNPNNLPHAKIEIITTVELNLTAQIKIPWWAYLLIILGATIILLIFSIILYKSGFFKRLQIQKPSHDKIQFSSVKKGDDGIEED